MATEKVTQRNLLLGQAGAQIPWLDLAEFHGHHIMAVITKKRNLVGTAFCLIGRLQGGAQRGQERCSVGLDGVKRSRTNECFNAPTIDCLPIDAATKVKQAGERSTRLPYPHDFLDSALPCPLDRPHAITDGAWWSWVGRIAVRHGLKSVARCVDVGGQHLNAIGQAITPKCLHLVGVIHVGRQGGRQELGWVMRLEPSRLESDQGIGRRV